MGKKVWFFIDKETGIVVPFEGEPTVNLGEDNYIKGYIDLDDYPYYEEENNIPTISFDGYTAWKAEHKISKFVGENLVRCLDSTTRNET